MPVEWSGLGPDLLVTLDRAAGVPLRTQVEEQLRTAIRNGRLAAGERLPSSRVLATSLGLSRGIVQECYAQLQAEGYLISRGGSATRVADTALGTRAAPPPRPTPPPTARLVADFATGVPDLGMAPREDWAWALREACRAAPNSALDYGDPLGHQTLREVLPAYLRRVRAVDAHPDQILICTGFQQGLALVLQALAGTGRTRVAHEDPGSTGTVAAAARAAGGPAVVPVPVDADGVDVAALSRSGAQVVLLTPAHQWPTGVVLAPHRRHQLVTWARERDAVIIEDDYDAEFRYDREPIGSVQGLAPDRVVTLGTVSKSLMPTLRLGWAVLPPDLVQQVARAKQIADRGTPGIDQLALATLIRAGRFDRHLRHMRAEYAQRRDVLVRALATHAPRVRLTGLAAGFHAVAHLPHGAEEHDVIARARDLGVALYGMSRYRSTHRNTPPQLVLGFGNTSTRAIQAGIEAVGGLLDDATHSY